MKGWTQTRVKWLTTEVRTTVEPGNLDTGEVFHYSIPSLDVHGDGTIEPSGGIGSNKLLLRGGEVLISKLNPRISRVLTASSHAIPTLASTEFIALVPGAGLDSRFFCSWLQSEPARQLLDGATMSVTRSQQRVRPDVLAKSRVDLPSVSVQRAIADYLDSETAANDALIAAKRSLLKLLEERDESELSRLVVPEGCELAHLRYFATVQGGLTVDAGRDVDAAAITRPYLRVANVQAGRLDLAEVTQITVSSALAARATLRKGDVLMTEGGDIDKLGRGTVWGGEIEGCLHQNHIFAVRPDERDLDSAYLACLTQTRHARAYFESTGVQSTNLASTSSSKILDLPIPVLPVHVQRDIVAQWVRRSTRTRGIRSALNRQIALLQERRQALITAAVTGQLDIPVPA